MFMLDLMQDMLNNEKSDELPLFSSQVLSALDDASEKTFLCSQRDVSKIGIEEKNLVALLGFIVEQALVRKTWLKKKNLYLVVFFVSL